LRCASLAPEVRQNHREMQITLCKLQPRARSRRKGAHFLAILVLACLVRCTTGMWDLTFILATVVFFAVSLAYVEGLQRL
jgi:hypothetical protein